MGAASPTEKSTPESQPNRIARRSIGDTGLSVSPIALDGAPFGWASGVGSTTHMLDLFRDSGGNLITTSDHYAGGRSEIMIGSWLRTVSDRSSIVLSTRVGRHPDAPGLTQRSILRAVESSLERLETDYIDLLSFDGDQPGARLDEALEAIDRLTREGKVRFLASNGFAPARIEEVARLAAESRYPHFGAIFAEYNLMDRRFYETEVQPMTLALGRGAVVRLPLAAGFLTGNFRTRDDLPNTVMFESAQRHVGRRGTRVLDALAVVAKELDTTRGRAALAWVLLKPGVAAATVRAKDSAELQDALGAGEIRLTRQHVALLDRASSF
jgi:aryl-alcohol dehydrogenase-like predicted oxidoreductase